MVVFKFSKGPWNCSTGPWRAFCALKEVPGVNTLMEADICVWDKWGLSFRDSNFTSDFKPVSHWMSLEVLESRWKVLKFPKKSSQQSEMYKTNEGGIQTDRKHDESKDSVGGSGGFLTPNSPENTPENTPAAVWRFSLSWRNIPCCCQLMFTPQTFNNVTNCSRASGPSWRLMNPESLRTSTSPPFACLPYPQCKAEAWAEVPAASERRLGGVGGVTGAATRRSNCDLLWGGGRRGKKRWRMKGGEGGRRGDVKTWSFTHI